ncbi:MAG TPA: chemotaxis protein CheA [Acidimicrobiales bacterium]|nr:chemotaxis protein CheA [Acidimicrobiales bacterium]
MDELDEIIAEFLVESSENLDRLDNEFIDLEEDPTATEVLGSIFRTIHTIKGTAGFLGFANLESVSHAGENLLSKLRDGVMTLDSELTDVLLAMVDAIRAMLAAIEETGSESEGDFSELIAKLSAYASGERPVAASPADEAEQPPTESEPAGEAALAPDSDDAPAAETAESSEVDTGSDALAAGTPESSEVDTGSDEPAAGTAESSEVDTGSDEPAESGVEPEAGAASGAPEPAAATEPAKKAARAPSQADSSIRVDVGLLDQLMNLVGELVLARNQILQHTSLNMDATLLATTQQLNLITSELQAGVMKTRMQPIGHLWARFPRVVRDLSNTCGKKVRLQMEGTDTELDKTILEAIRDPLTHILRNSVDHGIESPPDRKAVGKNETGLLRLRAYHEGGQVIIEIVDDGKGLDVARIAEKAVAKGLITPDRLARMTDREMANLVFLAGLSTAEAVTNVSGRGVGMDVVKRSIEEIGGTVDIQTELGVGTTLTLKIPLTLAIIPALSVTCDDHQYLVPQVSLVELLRIDPSSSAPGIENAGGSPVYRLRGDLLPIVYLRDVLGLERPHEDSDEVHNIAVLHADGVTFGLAVDSVNNTEEIVVKPLGPHLKIIDAFSGTTIMGDGTVALILDAAGIARGAGLLIDEATDPLAETLDEVQGSSGDRHSALICTVGGQRIAILLELITRLEEFSWDAVEKASGREVIQYRGRLLNLVNLTDVVAGADDSAGSRSKNLTVLVHEAGDRFYGLVVDDILDVHEADLAAAEPGLVPGVLCSTPIRGKVTDVIDIGAVIESVIPSERVGV